MAPGRKGYAFTEYFAHIIDRGSALAMKYTGESQNGHVGVTYTKGLLGPEPSCTILLPLILNGASMADTLSDACIAVAIRPEWQSPRNIGLLEYVTKYSPETMVIDDEDMLRDYGDYWDDLRSAFRRYRAQCIARTAMARLLMHTEIPEDVDPEAWIQVAYPTPNFQSVPLDMMARLNAVIASTGYDRLEKAYYDAMAREDTAMLQVLRHNYSGGRISEATKVLEEKQMQNVDLDHGGEQVADKQKLYKKPRAKQPIRTALKLLQQNWSVVYNVRSTYLILAIIAKLCDFTDAPELELIETIRETARYWPPM